MSDRHQPVDQLQSRTVNNSNDNAHKDRDDDDKSGLLLQVIDRRPLDLVPLLLYTFKEALTAVSVKLSRLIAGDGEGAQRLLECKVSSCSDEKTAKDIAKSIICSSLVKTAMFGADANWGRILCAIGYTEGDFSVDKIDVYLSSCKGKIKVCENGFGIEFSEEKAKEILLEDEIILDIEMNQGEYSATAWGCDLTYDYVKINGDYRT